MKAGVINKTAMRKTEFINDEYYHIYNRGADKREVFGEEKDYLRFLKSMREFNNNSTYEQRVYVKNKILQNKSENSEKEPSSEASELGSFSEFDSLMEFLSSLPKLVDIICYYLLWLSGYVNGNAKIHKIAKAENYKWSSYQNYL